MYDFRSRPSRRKRLSCSPPIRMKNRLIDNIRFIEVVVFLLVFVPLIPLGCCRLMLSCDATPYLKWLLPVIGFGIIIIFLHLARLAVATALHGSKSSRNSLIPEIGRKTIVAGAGA